MSATRTQIYLTEAQRSRINELTKSGDLTMAEVVRRAIDIYLDSERPDAGSALSRTFGANPDAGAPSRDEWVRG